MSGGGDTPSPTPAEPNLFYRVCPVSGVGTPVIVDENGEVCYVDHGGNFSVLRYNVATGVITEDATDAVLTACEVFTGGGYELELSTDASGHTVYTNGDYHITVNNSGAIVDGEISEFDSQDVIPISGDAQVFADQACTKYPAGQTTDKVYVRLNQTYNASKTWGEYGSELALSWPEVPADGYIATWCIDFMKQSDENFFIAGTVFEVSSASAYTLGNNCPIVYSS